MVKYILDFKHRLRESRKMFKMKHLYEKLTKKILVNQERSRPIPVTIHQPQELLKDSCNLGLFFTSSGTLTFCDSSIIT